MAARSRRGLMLSGLAKALLTLHLGMAMGAPCPMDSACLNGATYEFFKCSFSDKVAPCFREVAKFDVKGTFDNTTMTFVTDTGAYPYSNDCTTIAIPDLGYTGKLTRNKDPALCYITGSQALKGQAFVQFTSSVVPKVVPPSPCDLGGQVALLDCPDISDCHRGNWNISLCTGTCEETGSTSCLASNATDILTVKLNYGDGVLWLDGKTYPYEFSKCRTLSVPGLKLEGYFTEPANSPALCDVISSGTWSGGVLSGVKTSDIPKEDKGLKGLGLYIAIGAFACLLIVGVMLYFLKKKWTAGKVPPDVLWAGSSSSGRLAGNALNLDSIPEYEQVDPSIPQRPPLPPIVPPTMVDIYSLEAPAPRG